MMNSCNKFAYSCLKRVLNNEEIKYLIDEESRLIIHFTEPLNNQNALICTTIYCLKKYGIKLCLFLDLIAKNYDDLIEQKDKNPKQKDNK